MDTISNDQTAAASRALSEFLCALQYEDIPHAVVLRTEDLFLDWFAAAVAGYECGVRVGEFLGRSHYKVFHTTGTAGKLAAAAGVARLLKLDSEKMQHCLGSAGTMAAGLWEFLRDAADSKQLH